MKDMKPLYYLTLALLTIILFASNFVDSGLFNGGIESFSAWFVLTLLAFVCGWVINKSFGWKTGGKLVFAVSAAATMVSLFMVSFFENYFSLQSPLIGDLIIYSLRSLTLGAFSFFGMSVAEVITLQRENENCRSQKEEFDKRLRTNEKEAELILKEAKLNAERIVFEAEKKAKGLIDKKDEIENQLRELIRVEKELIRKYESEDE